MLEELSTSSRVYVAGHRGLVGSSVMRRLAGLGFENLITATSSELDLRNQDEVRAFMAGARPEIVVLAAAKVGGILANSTFPGQFLYNNLMIAVNVIEAARVNGVRKLLNLGSSCIYPRSAPQPLKEEYLLTGSLEPTNRAYAVAKIGAIELCDAYRAEYGCDFISAMPTNLYGPNDNFDLASSHVLPALLRKMDDARRADEPTVTVWGSGTPRREFLYVDDLADACLFLLANVSEPGPINVGTGSDLTIHDLALLIKEAVGFEGDLVFDMTKPDGTPRKLMDVSRLREMGWTATTSLEDGIARTYRWYQEQVATSRA